MSVSILTDGSNMIQEDSVRNRFRQKKGPLPVTNWKLEYRLKLPGQPWYLWQSVSPYFGIHYYMDLQYCWDQLHNKLIGPNGKTYWDSGGPFNVDRISGGAETRFESVHLKTIGNYEYRYTGGWTCLYKNGEVGLQSGLSTETPIVSRSTEWGNRAWEKFRPNKARASIGQFIAEANDAPRMLKTTAKAFYKLPHVFNNMSRLFHEKWKAMGGKRYHDKSRRKRVSLSEHWLNTQFGWRPFVADIGDFFNTTTHLDKHCSTMYNNNGQWVKRGGPVHSENTGGGTIYESTTTTAHYPHSLGVGVFMTKPYDGSHTISRYLTESIWYTARYRYYLPELLNPGSNWRNSLIRRVYGLDITPTLLYELTPWSWLIDWYAHLGKTLDRAQAIIADQLTTKYAFLMTHRQETCMVDSVLKFNGSSLRHQWNYTIDSKRREGASPFGFGPTVPTELSGFQWSILAALGLTRLH